MYCESGSVYINIYSWSVGAGLSIGLWFRVLPWVANPGPAVGAKSGLFVGGSSESLLGLRLRVLPLVVEPDPSVLCGSGFSHWLRVRVLPPFTVPGISMGCGLGSICEYQILVNLLVADPGLLYQARTSGPFIIRS